jgi:hypothetical protein
MAGNANFQTMATVAIDSRTRKLSDNLSRSNALLYALKENGGIKPFSGGNKILQEIEYTSPGNAQSYSGLDSLNTNDGEFATSAEFGIKQYASSAIFSGLSLAQASGKERMIDLLESKINNAETGLINKMVEDLYSDGTGNSGKALTGLQAAVDLTPAVGVYGNIDPATNTFWRNQAISGTAITDVNVWAKFFAMYTSLVRGVETPDVIVTCSAHWTALNTFLQQSQRFNEGSAKLAKAGFDNVQFMKAAVVLENDSATGMPSDKSYFLTTKYLHLRPYGSMDFTSFGTDPDAQDATVKRMKWYGNLTCSRRLAQGVVSDA